MASNRHMYVVAQHPAHDALGVVSLAASSPRKPNLSALNHVTWEKLSTVIESNRNCNLCFEEDTINVDYAVEAVQSCRCMHVIVPLDMPFRYLWQRSCNVLGGKAKCCIRQGKNNALSLELNSCKDNKVESSTRVSFE